MKQPKMTNFIELLVKKVPYKYNLKKYKMSRRPVEQLGYEVDDSHKFRNSVYVFEAPAKSEKVKKKKMNMETYTDRMGPELDTYAIDTANWEQQIFDSGNGRPPIDNEVREYVNRLLDTNWEANIIYDGVPRYRSLILHADDPNLIFEAVEKKSKIKKKNYKNTNFEKPLKNKYNISNDKYYENETKTKTSLVAFGVQHSIPALKLNPVFYRVDLTDEELRNFHKPPLRIENKIFMFSRPMQITPSSSIIKKPYEITCNDLADFVLFEYSEENPLFIVNPGMVSVCNKYYRKVDTSDDLDPKNHIVLEPDDEGPFLGYGEIPKGETGECLDNNLFVAPLFKHKSNDYLIICTQDKLIYRKIPFAYLVGQELPKEEIFIPQSRKLNQFCRDEVKVLAFRHFNKNQELSGAVLERVLPHFSDGAKRKWLKEFTDASKKGKETFFTLKTNALVLNEEEIRKLVTPENICQYQSMLAGERRMEDLGYRILEDENEETDYIPNWLLCRNFVNASNGKGLLEIRGQYDSTGIGEAMSFGRVKFKKATEAENRRLMSDHQAKYKSEILSVWNKQWISLSSSAVLEKPAPKPKSKATKAEEASQSETIVESKSLIIKRTYFENDRMVERMQKISDPKVIRAYLKARKKVKVDDKKVSLKCSSCGQTGHMKTNKNCPNYVGTKKSVKEKKKGKALMQERLLKLINQFSAIPYSSPFHRPVSDKKFPMYKTIVHNPMDFLKMKSNIKGGVYTKYDMFLNDIKLIYENCKLFNGLTHSLTDISNDFYERAKTYKVENYIDLTEIEHKIEKNE
ncbi:TFIID 111K sub [Enterospora canceri]|uniref:TFIID 111K sub n=1 Tax=Enterospora canceri TaxID=1081671 RepID=A0A1Y1S9I9_9MICR|nr:TFIID 111K sub [Enterospora canceri]